MRYLGSRAIRRVATAMPLALACLTLGFSGATAPLSAQSSIGPRVAEKMKLESAEADSNDATQYVALGERLRDKGDFVRAADAFYWASRLDPSNAVALQRRWLALISMAFSKRKEFDAYVGGGTKMREEDEIQRADSLALLARLRDPFALVGLVIISRDGDARITGTLFIPSVPMLRDLIARHPADVDARFVQAANFYSVHEFDSTISQLSQAVEQIRKNEQGKRGTRIYHSREIFEYAVARAQMARGDMNAAREACGRALAENLAFYPAHGVLGSIAWTNWSDLATATSEYETALQLNPKDAILQYDFGSILLNARRHDEAIAHLRAATELEPYWAEPYFNLALAYDRAGNGAAARASYRDFIAHAPRRLAKFADVARQRVTAIEHDSLTKPVAPPTAPADSVRKP